MVTNIVDVYRRSELMDERLYMANIVELSSLYFVAFAHLPSTIVYNRPCIDIITSFVVIILCMVSCMLVVCNLRRCPTRPSRRAWQISSSVCSQFSMVVSSFAAMLVTLETKHPLYIFTSSDDLYKKIHKSEYDMTLYFKMISVATFLLSGLAWSTICLQIFFLRRAALKNFKRLNQVWSIKSSNSSSLCSAGSDETLVAEKSNICSPESEM